MLNPSGLKKFRLKDAGLGLLMGLLLLLVSPAVGLTQDLDHSLGWKSFGSVGNIVYAPVQLDGYDLFTIAAERKKEEGEQRGWGALQIRRNRIENRLKAQLRYLLDQGTHPEALQVITTQLNQQTAVQAVIDGKATQPIVTVTALDAEIYGLSENEVAEEYAKRIQQGLLRAMQERQATVQQSQFKAALVIGGITALLMALLFGWRRRIDQVRRKLQRQFREQQQDLSRRQTACQPDSGMSPDLVEQKQQLFDLKRRIEQKTWQKQILFLSLIGVGVIGMAWILQRFPQTRSLGVFLFRQPLGLLLIWLTIAIVIVGSRILVDRVLTRWVGTEDPIPLAQIERRQQRLPTLSTAWKDVITTLLIVVGVFLSYSLLSLATGLSLVTQIGVLGVAASLVFQSSIKDALTGWMLMARDAYTVGDLVTVKEYTGVVEDLSLFLTQIRSSPGALITLRNGEITTIANYSKDWSRLDFTVLVDHATDVKQAMTLMQEVFQSLQTDPRWGLHLIDEPDILGVEQFQPDGILLRLRTQTQPGQQYDVAREFRLRLNQAFQKIGIQIAIPQRQVRYREPQVGTEPSHR
jgi:small conductance mechanosensitive channel